MNFLWLNYKKIWRGFDISTASALLIPLLNYNRYNEYFFPFFGNLKAKCTRNGSKRKNAF
jgi:hypothetical protein